MSFQLIVAIGFILLIFVIFGLGLYYAITGIRNKEKLDQAEGAAKDASKRMEKRTDPVLSDAEYRDRLRRAQERYARLRDRKTKR